MRKATALHGGLEVLALLALMLPALAAGQVGQPLVLESFESEADLASWEPHAIAAQLTTDHATEGRHAVKLEYPAYEEGGEQWPAFILHQAAGIEAEANWRRYSVLRYDVFVERGSDDPEVARFIYKLRLDDAAGSRWTTSREIPVGKPYTFELKLADAEIDRSRVVHLDLFMTKPEAAWTVYLDNIRLEVLPLELREIAAYDDPFMTGNVRVIGELSEAARYRVEIRDDREKLVRHFSGRGLKVDWEWDGRDEAGNPVPQGVYHAWLLARGKPMAPGWEIRRWLAQVPVKPTPGRDYVWWPLRSTEEVFLDTRPAREELMPRELHLQLARNEYEAAQIAIRARPGFDLEGVHVSVDQLRRQGSQAEFPSDGITIYQVGHVETHEPPPPYDHDFLGWHPDPLIEADTFDIAAGDTQAVWVQLKTSSDLEAGEYRGTVLIEPANAAPAEIPFHVTVWDFVLPDISHCRTLFDMRSPLRVYPDRAPDEVMRQYQEFVFEHRINPWRIYNADPPSIEFLETFMPRGMNAVNLIHIREGECTEEKQAEIEAKLDPVVDFLREKGWTDRACIYAFDETRSWENLKTWADWVQEKYPDIDFGTTSRDATYGVETGIDNVDFWTPLTPHYHREQADARREQGYEIWWYICIGPHHPHANWFIEYPLIEARLLWWMTYQYRSDGFLYYAINRWPVNEKPLEGAPRTDWDPASYKSANGDGCLLYGGPEGPITGMRFETVRDGLEEYEYLWLLQQRLGERRTGEEICGRLIRSLTDYSRDSEEFYQVRRQLAQAIVAAAAP